jgi:hypothetical protein
MENLNQSNLFDFVGNNKEKFTEKHATLVSLNELFTVYYLNSAPCSNCSKRRRKKWECLDVENQKNISVEITEQNHSYRCTWNVENKQIDSNIEEDEYISGVSRQSEDDVYGAKVLKTRTVMHNPYFVISKHVMKA